MAAAALVHSLVQNHPFHNGNKRTALVALLAFLDKNDLLVMCDEDALYVQVLKIAKHNLIDQNNVPDLSDREVLVIAEWIHENSRGIEKGDHPLQWRRLKRILGEFQCECTVASGNRIDIVREVKRSRRWLKSKKETLYTQVAYADDGRDADRSTVSKIREDLKLDEPNGVDSAAFYQRAPYCADDFIVKYRKTLRRLAKL